MRAWITKYALTSGIEEVEAKVCDRISDRMIEVIEPMKPGSVTRLFHKPYWHETAEAAVAHANELRDKKIASHGRSVSMLRKLKFAVPA